VRAGVLGVVGMLAALLLIAAIAVAFFGIETRQQSLEALRPHQPEHDPLALDAAVPRSRQT
jgi:hypothetical protein